MFNRNSHCAWCLLNTALHVFGTWELFLYQLRLQTRTIWDYLFQWKCFALPYLAFFNGSGLEVYSKGVLTWMGLYPNASNNCYQHSPLCLSYPLSETKLRISHLDIRYLGILVLRSPTLYEVIQKYYPLNVISSYFNFVNRFWSSNMLNCFWL